MRAGCYVAGHVPPELSQYTRFTEAEWRESDLNGRDRDSVGPILVCDGAGGDTGPAADDVARDNQ